MDSVVRCSRHPFDPAGWTCSACEQQLCLQCAVRRRAGQGSVVVCRACGGFAQAIMLPRARETFLRSVPGAFAYPFSLNGLLTALACGVIFWLLGVAGVLGGLVARAALISYLFLVVRSSSTGSEDLPESEDLAHLADLAFTLLKAVLAFGLSLAPFLLYVFYLRGRLGVERPYFVDPLVYMSLLTGFLWTPAALMLAAINSPVSSIVNPAIAVQVIRRLGFDYVVASALFWGSLVGWTLFTGVGEMFVQLFGMIPLLPRLISATLVLYPLFVGARILGLLLFARGDDIGYGMSSEYLEPALGAAQPPEEEAAPPAPRIDSISADLPPATPTPVSVPANPLPPPPEFHGVPTATDDAALFEAILGGNSVPPAQPASDLPPPPDFGSAAQETPQDEATLFEAILGPGAGPSAPAPAVPDLPTLPDVPPVPVLPMPSRPPATSLPPKSIPPPTVREDRAESATVIATPPTDDDIRAMVAASRFDAVAKAYRTRRGNVAVLTPEQLVRTAEAALAMKDAQTASHAYKRIGYDHPRSALAPPALLKAGRLLRQQMGKESEGAKLLSHLVRAYPQTTEAREAQQLLGGAA